MRSKSPRFPRAILSAALPPDERRAVLAELDAEYEGHIRTERGPAAASLWYWSQVLRSIAPALAMRRRRARRRGAAERPGASPLVRRTLDQSAQEFRIALRTLKRRPGFAAAAIATFALGIGANTAIFSVVDGVLLQPLPYRDAHELVRVWSANPRGIPRNAVSPADYFDFAEQARAAHVFESLAAFTAGDTATVTGDGEPARVVTSTVSHEFFETLGVPPSRGRAFESDDVRGVSTSVAVISDHLWKTRFDGRADAVGSPIVLDGETYTIVGVTPASFDFPAAAIDVWVPMPESVRRRSRSAHFLDVVGRLSDGVTEAAALDTLRTIARRLETQYPDTNRGWGVTIASLHDSVVGDARRPLLVLLAAVGCVLLIACANVASLLLARGAGRSREMAVRAALGAGRARIAVGQLMETAILAVCGGAAGLLIAWLTLELLRSGIGYQVPRVHEVGLDLRILFVTAVVSLLTGLAAGLAPAWRAARIHPDAALKAGRAAGATVAATRTRTLLVTCQIALTLALTVGAGLLVKSFARLTSVDAGFRADHVLLAEVTLPLSRYEPQRWAAYVERGVSELRTLPGVIAAGAGAPLPLSGQQGLLRFGVRFEGRPDPADGRSDRAYLRWATPDYFRAMGIALVEGRAFEDRDRADSAPVAIVDRAFAERYFPNEPPIGRRIRMTNERVFREVVGVVGSVRQTRLEDAPEPHVYVAQAQKPSPIMTFVVRTAQDPTALAGALRAKLHAIDQAQPVYNVRTLADLVAGAAAARRFNAVVLALFAGIGGLLTIVGVYGLMAFWVGESRREFGVRVALGATRGEILALVLRRGLRLTAWGTIAGLIIAFCGVRLLTGLLFGVSTVDPASFGYAAALLVSAALAGSWLPARRALSAHPGEVLKGDG